MLQCAHLVMSTFTLPPNASPRADHRPALVILALFLALGVLYSISTPVMEASDELRHYPFVRHLAQGGSLPVQRPGEPTLWGQEGSQPPLYYALMGALTFWVDASDLPGLMQINPHAEVGVPLAFDNKNHVLHTGQEAFPWRGASLAVHLVRLFSVLLAAGTVICTYLLALDLFPDRPAIAIAAMAVNAFLPMFLFVSASVNNDTLVTLLSSVALLMMVRLVLSGASWLQLALLGVIIGLACLSKLGALGLLPLAALAVGLRVFVTAPPEDSDDSLLRRTGRWVTSGLVVALPALAVAGWWYLRNWRLYGDPTGITAMLDIAGRRPVTPGLSQLLGEFQGFRINFWGLFGAINVLMRPDWIYTLLDVATALALLGLVAWALTRRRAYGYTNWPALLVPAAWIGIEFAGLVRWTSLTAASQGRLMFPAIAAICLFLALGWLGVWSPRAQRRGALLIAGGMFTIALLAPFLAIRPAYPRPSDLVVESVPTSAQPVDYIYGGAARLLAYEISDDSVAAGEPLDVTLYWQALAPMAQDYSVYVQAAGWRQALDQQDSYPGGGTHPTSHWLPGQIIRDRYRLDASANVIGPGPAWLAAGLYDFQTMERLPVTDAAGRPVVYPTLARLEIEPGSARWQPQQPLDANFGGLARATGFDVSAAELSPGSEWKLTLYWEALAPMGTDYTVFVHVEDAAGNIVAQTDLQPTGGVHPTSAWTPGHTLKDSYRLTLSEDTPPGEYRVFAGVYDPATGERLPLLGSSGAPPDNQLQVTTLRVLPSP
jgi:4-amino-4-deoxy-L-arabinose transferase-like glycosyltransferase